MYTVHDLVQGSAEWHQFRLEHFGASEAAAMLGLSSKVKRTELLHMKYTCLPKEFSDWVQANILDYGHEVEALARPLIEARIGQDLYPVTCSNDLLPPGCARRLSASLDGLTMDDETAFEHKQWNAELAASVEAGILPDEFQPQCQQITMVTPAKRVIFTVSDGTPERMVFMEVRPDPAWHARIIAGWEQFEKDLLTYEPKQFAEKPAPEAIIALPALVANIRGEVVTTNLPTFKAAAERFIANIKTDLQTDQDFADAEATVKFCDAAEKDLERAKAAAIAQTASIDDLMRTVDHIKDQLRMKRLALEKLVKTKKEQIKESILSNVKLAYAEHVVNLEAEIRPIRIALPVPDFAGAMKNKRTLASLHDAVDTLLASAKIAANDSATDIRAKLAWHREAASDYPLLFADLRQLVAKPMDDFQLVVTTRIAEHKKAEEERAAKVRAEEQATADLVAAQTKPEGAELSPAVQAANEAEGATRFQAAHPAIAAPFQVVRPTAPTTPPNLRLGQIADRLGFSLTADFLRALGFEPAGRDKAAVLYHESDFRSICAALIRHISAAQDQEAA
jgi:predicted phage-related endonuclease